ncbi:MAG: TIGR03619 family F420-dependent LLM class oxidoreductase [Haloarculaceae archaeon]
MDLGVAPPTFATDGWRLPASRLERFVRRAEALDFAGVWVTEHLLHPPNRGYSRLAPMTTIATVAGATESIPVGTSVLILPLRDPVLVAQRAATLQHLSEERLTLGLGLGWVEAEFDAVDVPWGERGHRFSEALALVRRLLAEREVTFDGEFYEVEALRLEPHVSRPPRILVGGGGVERGGERSVPRAVKERLLHHADGWLAPPRPPSVLETDWREIAGYLEREGRDPSTLDRVALNWLHLVPGVDGDLSREKQRRVFTDRRGADAERTAGAMENQLTGSVEEVRELVGEYRRLGFDELVLGPTTHDPDEAERQLERWDDLLR